MTQPLWSGAIESLEEPFVACQISLVIRGKHAGCRNHSCGNEKTILQR